jgi:beta-phosphoglucomutase family hydrolase
MSMNENRGVIFDLDGVLLDSAEFHKESWYRLAGELGIPYTDAFFVETFGMTNHAIIPRMVKREVPPGELDRLSERKEFLFREQAKGRISLFEGAIPLFEELKREGFRLALGTSTPESNVRFFYAELGLDRHLRAYTCSNDVNSGKPDPEVFLLAAERLGLPPARCVVVEDAVAGVQAANAGGMRCIAVTTTRTEADLRAESRPDLVVETIAVLNAARFAEVLES